MKILLLSNNPVINKLTTLASQRLSYVLTIIENSSNLFNVYNISYDFLIIDSDFDKNLSLDNIVYSKLLNICSREEYKKESKNSLIKPFLPEK